MKCDDVLKMLPEYVSGELGRSSEEGVKEHISVCESCRLESEEFENALSAISQSRERLPVPPSLDILKMPEKNTLFPSLRPVMATAVLVIVLVAILLIVSPWRAPHGQDGTPESQIVDQPVPVEGPGSVGLSDAASPVNRTVKPLSKKKNVACEIPGDNLEDKGAPAAVKNPELINKQSSGDLEYSSVIWRPGVLEIPRVEIETVDPETGKVRRFTREKSSAGEDKVVEINSSAGESK